jgi:hypothetical protein
MSWKEILTRVLLGTITAGGSEGIRAMIRNEIKKELARRLEQKLDEFEEELS